jgi:hypothetical protein
MTINEIIGNNKRKSKVDTELWKKMNTKYSDNSNNITNEKSQEYNLYKTPKPEIILQPLDNTVVWVPFQNEYDTLMQIYECADWKWLDKTKATTKNYWTITSQENTCISAGKMSAVEQVTLEPKEFGSGHKDNFPINKYTRLSIELYCKEQGITLEKVKEINGWYDTNKPDRASKG